MIKIIIKERMMIKMIVIQLSKMITLSTGLMLEILILNHPTQSEKKEKKSYKIILAQQTG